ncbi:MAG: YdcH family protein [Gammaproteobacteria bacterium]|nr:YdcH family protein [Gammaproteobacteria bacterium]MBT8134697.1 YdcH family protein [Gammaproteobacteria bacterium]NNJ50288.1 YdcH family protein [Gammaproteobacteria bacterium]
MPISHHPLIEEFAEYKDAIHDLKMNNSHFRRLANEYEGIDKSIFRAEQGIEVVNDDYLDSIKKERLHLKDLIYSMLRK